MKIYAMLIDEKTLCGSITRSYLQKLSYQHELSFCGLPHHVRALPVPGVRVGQTQTIDESHTQQELEAELVKYGNYLAFYSIRDKRKVEIF